MAYDCCDTCHQFLYISLHKCITLSHGSQRPTQRKTSKLLVEYNTHLIDSYLIYQNSGGHVIDSRDVFHSRVVVLTAFVIPIVLFLIVFISDLVNKWKQSYDYYIE